ncbi:hypothetical protein LXL04_023816 [Taraxacum kok-saghyz]
MLFAFWKHLGSSTHEEEVGRLSHSLYEYDDAPNESTFTCTCTVGPTITPNDKWLLERYKCSKEKELEMLMAMKDGKNHIEETEEKPNETSMEKFSNFIKNNKNSIETQEKISLEAANSLLAILKNDLQPFKVITDDKTPWEEKSAAVKLANKLKKDKRNKLWRKRKRQHIGEMLSKEREQFDQADREADEWRAREIANEVAKQRVEKMKEIAKQKAKEERKRLESELELVLIVEKLQELRSIRIQKLTKQEDNKFLERIRVAVEEEERQLMAAADISAAKDAITSVLNSEDQITVKDDKDNQVIKEKTNEKEVVDVDNHAKGSYDYSSNLPLEFYHYYHGSGTDMGTLIEVRRTWDAYIRPGGSRIPGHWVQASPPADEIWASYVVKKP